MFRLHPIIFVCLTLVLVAPTGTLAAEIFHWVDENGVHHYSDDAPAAVDEVRTLEVDGSQPADYDPDEDRYQVAAQAEATQEVWDRLEESRKEKQEQRERELERQAANQVIYYPDPYRNGSNIYYPPYQPWPPYGRPPARPPLKPVHPIEPPTVEPAPSVPFRPPGR